MKTIDEHIKTGQFKNAYLLYGDEDYLKKQYRDKLIKALLSEGDTMNFAKFEGKDISVGEVIDLAETLPFFADRRVILISDSGFFKDRRFCGGQRDESGILYAFNRNGKHGDIRKLYRKRPLTDGRIA